ncbi:PHP-associated domain-containing protein [Clostridium culturomicium]|uniref:PHP-associated domain-containing protein n=1 Tax=Clostridium culturomicium TaxID=1499683 RepID=UPI003857A669
MNLDFHVHGILSRKSCFNEEFFLLGIENAKEQGLDGFILCDHFNAENIDQMYKYLEENYEYEGDRYFVNGFYVFLGIEVNVKNGGHVIVSGNREDIYEIKDVLIAYSVKPNFIPLKELLNLAESHNCLTIGCHPYRGSHNLCLQSKEELKRLDALDLNAKDIFNRGKSQAEAEVKALSEELEIPFVTGSDSHFPMQLGSVKSIFEKEFLNVMEIKVELKLRNPGIYVSPALDLKVFSAKVAKRYIKKLEVKKVIN